VLHSIKDSKFVKFAKFGILDDFRVLYFIKVTKFVKLGTLVFWKIFMFYTT